ncbi:hypothetical protein J3A83DRAFT_4543660 [Scleroderma citrinum]
MALALDTTTLLEGRGSPEGILYTGGRDGQVISWDLGLPFQRRRSSDLPLVQATRWERLTGMADETLVVVEGEEEYRDGDILGDVKESGGRKWKDRNEARTGLPFEHRWELDLDAPGFNPHAHFRQCVQLHADWINDTLLCNYNQTVITASSDGTLKSWSPHTSPSTEPSTIGLHADYVRCLALSRERNWITSGSFDRTIKLWDLTRSSSVPEPIVTLNPPDPTASKASIYALAVDLYGHVIASGSPERVVRMWDPRAGKRVGKLVGHTDNIRAILISEDARYLLTGSADASIKLWSLSSQRCLHTFTHHTDSVWALHSSHPSLEVFYSGDKSGIICKVDVDGCGDVADGACIVLSQDSDGEAGDGINKLVAADDGFLWAASGSSSISRWKLPRRIHGHTIEGEEIPATDSSAPAIRKKFVSLGVLFVAHKVVYSPMAGGRKDEVPSYPDVSSKSLLRLTSLNGPYSPSSYITRNRDAEVATLYSTASIVSVPGGRSPFGTAFQQHPATISPPNSLRNMKSIGSISNADHELPHDTRQVHELPELASEAEPYNKVPDSVIPGSRGLVRAILLNDRMHALTVDTKGEVAVWDIIRGVCRGRYTKEDVRAANRCSSTNSSARSRCSGSVVGDKEGSPREALEIVRERIEGEAVISPWSSVDTKTGVLTVHINDRWFEAEMYADEAGYEDKRFSDEQRLNIGKWVLRNLFLGFIREEQRIRKKREEQVPDSCLVLHSNLHRDTAPSHIDLDGNAPGRYSSSDISTRSSSRTPISTAVITSPFATPAIIPLLPTTTKPSSLLPSMIPLATSNVNQALHSTHPLFINRTPKPIRTHGLDIPPPSTTGRDVDYFSARSQKPSAANSSAAESEVPGWSDPSSPTKVTDSPISATPTSAGGLMGRLKNFGKAANRRPNNEAPPGSPVISSSIPRDSFTAPEQSEVKPTKTPAQALLSNAISPPSSSEMPTLNLPPSLTVMMSDESYPGWRIIYRRDVSNMWADIYTLEETMPLWLLEYLLMNKAPTPPNVKISFVLLPWRNPDPAGEQLPELLNTTQSKLTASRFLRVRKLTYHVYDKLEKILTRSNSPSGTPLVDSPAKSTFSTRSHRERPEETYEILCNDSVLSLDMTLAAVRQYFWRQSSELVMHYRLRRRERMSSDSTDAPVG